MTVDDSEFADVDADTAQEGMEELQRLFGIVNALTPGAPPTSGARPLNIFTTSVTITDGNYDDFANQNNIYAAGNNQRVNFVLPAESDIPSYPAIFEITNLGGTQRFDTGRDPTNTVSVRRPPDYDPDDFSTHG